MSIPVKNAQVSRMPIRAVLVLAGAWLLVTIQVILGGLLGVGFIPLAPVVLFGGACLLSSAHQYAAKASLAVRPEALEKERRATTLSVQISPAE